MKLKDDIMFKAFFSRKENQKFLEGLLEAILEEPVKVKHVIHDARLDQLSKEEKYGVLDLDVERDNGQLINIEMQVMNQHNIEKRVNFYGSKKFAGQARPGITYENLKDVIVIAILDYNLFDVEAYHNRVISVLEDYRYVEVDDSIKTIFIELPKFRESNPDMHLLLNQWLSFLDREKEELLFMAKENNQAVALADEAYNVLTGDAELKRLEEVRMLSYMEEASALSTARNEGKEIGIEIGRKKGKIIGINIGIERIAKRMLKEKMPIEDISRITGLSEEQIKNLK